MDKITSKTKLVERLKETRIFEVNAKKSYEEDMTIFTNPEMLNMLKEISLDESKHINILDA